MKKYIDYFFWKRWWFRKWVIFFPSWIIPVVCVFSISFNSPTFTFAISGEKNILKWIEFLVNLYVFTIILAMFDDENVGNPLNPFSGLEKALKAKKAP